VKNSVFITCVGRKVSLVKAFKDAGWYVYGADSDRSAAALRFCDQEAYTDSVIDELSVPPWDLVVPTRDGELLNYAGQGMKAMCASRETIEICRNKLMMGKVLEDAGLKTPKVLFCKPQDGAGSRNSMMMYQEFINGEEYSVDLFADFSGTVISVVPRRRLKVLSGESSVTETCKNSALIAEAIKLSSVLKLIGHSVLQCFVSGGNIIWTDVNCRFGGASIVAIKAGCLSPLWMKELINGYNVKPCIGDYKVGLIGRSYTEWDFDGLYIQRELVNWEVLTFMQVLFT
jgi:carbamoyl-phosphate synthase large subunit